jgi:tRNA pseudouridine38-40 synthase
MDDATRCFVGTHDFTSFCATATEVEDRVRTIFAADWQRDNDLWVFRISGSGFLQYMVRTIVGTLLYVGAGKTPASHIPPMFEARDRRLAGPCVPASGLHLIRVEY